MAEFPVAFIFFVSSFEASEALAFCHDEMHDIMDLHQFGHNLVGFYAYSDFALCRDYCVHRHFQVVCFSVCFIAL